MEQELHLGVPAECRDGPAGKLRQVVLDRATETVTYLVIDTTPHRGFAVLAPRALVKAADHERLQLTCTRDELAHLDRFEETVFLPPDRSHPTLGYPAAGYFYAGGYGSGVGPMGMGSAGPGLAATAWPSPPPSVVEEHLPPGGAAIGRDAAIETADGELGRVDEVLTDPATGKLTHLVVRRGHLFGAHTLVVPASAIDAVTDERVRLRFTRGELEAALRPSGEETSAGASVLALFATRQHAEAALTLLAAGGCPVEALSAATPQGQAVRFTSGRERPGAGECRHVAVGAVVGAIPDVVLFGHLLIWASVVTGGLVELLTS
ncbi:MAG TPA: PRC-barrel domain-containing protein, partial [Gemmatimonadales bacterium]|nr:PRC-barrel domain-containing protein [Gemmatimonadales bacterium]